MPTAPKARTETETETVKTVLKMWDGVTVTPAHIGQFLIESGAWPDMTLKRASKKVRDVLRGDAFYPRAPDSPRQSYKFRVGTSGDGLRFARTVGSVIDAAKTVGTGTVEAVKPLDL